jgi:hypothetical protein
MPVLVPVPTPALQPAASVHKPEPNHTPAPAPASAPAPMSDVPKSLFTVELDKAMVNTIKCTAKEELHCVMMQERDTVLATQKQ